MAEKQLGIDETLVKIDDIVSKLESGSVPLEQALELYKEGATLILNCNKMLAEAELTLSKIKFELNNNSEAQDEQ